VTARFAAIDIAHVNVSIIGLVGNLIVAGSLEVSCA